jgi:hypothetical protein
MKKIILLLIFLFLQICIFAQNTEHYLKIFINDRSELETLTRMVSIANVTGNEVVAFANNRELEKLAYSNFIFEELEHPSVQSGRAITMATTVEQMANWDRYPTYDVYNQLMRKFATDYPNLCKLDTIGTSIQGRNMLVVNITAGIHTTKPKPEVLFSGTIHGNETAGWILCMRLAHHLLSNYGTDTRITAMLDSISIFIAPNTNPDGTYYNNNNNSVANARRGNANGYDLNRNFPDPWAGPTPGETRQKEAIVMMDYAGTRNFILSINYHGGEVVANYPWDGWTSYQRKHPDNDWFISICRQYADLAQANGPPNYFTKFNNGITNGGDWYVIYGGRQDYTNYWQNCREVTLEVSTAYILGTELLQAYWNYNKESMLAYIENVKYGIRGFVTNTDGEPLDAKITVLGHDNYNSHVVTNPEFGNYYRMINAGTYTLLFETYGYETQQIPGVVSQNKQTELLDVIMQKSPICTVDGIVIDAATGSPLENVKIEVKKTPIAPLITDQSGNFALVIPKGTYQFVLTKENFIRKEQTVVIDENTDFLVFSLDLFDGFSFENGIPSGFSFSGNKNWYIVNNQSYHGTSSIRSGTIANSQSSTMTYTFNAANDGKVIFASKVSSEVYDKLEFFIDNVSKGSWRGDVDWAEHAYDVSAGDHTLRWTYSKNGTLSYGSDCAWVDFISVPPKAQYAIPYVTPRLIDFATKATSGDTIITIWNIGTATMNFDASVEDEQNNTWLSLSNNSGVLAAKERKNIILSYDFTSLPCAKYETNVQIDVGDSIINIPVSILFLGCDEDNGIPYVTPRSIDIETEELAGDCIVTMQNIGNKAFDYKLSIEPEECEWLTLSHDYGILDAAEQVEIVLSYDVTPIVTKRNYLATLNIDVTDSVIHIPIKINVLLNILTPEEKDFKIYPNPTTGEFKVESLKFKVEGVKVFDVYGRKQKATLPSVSTDGTEWSLDLSNLSAGIYFVKIITEKREVIRKVIKY